MCINPPVPAGRFLLNPAASAAETSASALSGVPPHWRQQMQQWMAAAQRSHDAITLAQAAEQAMARVQAHLARMHALAVEASNSDVPQPERSKAQQEINQRVADIDRIARTTAVAGQPLLDGAVQAGSAVLACLPNLRAQSLSDLRYAAQCWVLEGVASTAAPTALPVALPAATGLTLAVGDQPPVALGPLPAATSVAQRLAQLCQVINDQTARTGVAAFIQPVQHLQAVSPAQGADYVTGVDGATDRADTLQQPLHPLQWQLLSRQVGAQGQALPVQLGGVVQAVPQVRSSDSAACAREGWTVHAVCGLHSISLASPASAWVGQLQLEQAAAQLRSARARFAACSLLGRLGVGGAVLNVAPPRALSTQPVQAPHSAGAVDAADAGGQPSQRPQPEQPLPSG